MSRNSDGNGFWSTFIRTFVTVAVIALALVILFGGRHR